MLGFSKPKRRTSSHSSSHKGKERDRDGERERERRHRESRSDPRVKTSYTNDPAASKPTAKQLTEDELENIAVTFENIIAHVNGVGHDTVTATSVRSMMEDIYRWLLYDADMQLTIPTVDGDTSVKKMWPQGAKVNTRRKESNKKDANERALDTNSNADVASVVSSTVPSNAGDHPQRIPSHPKYMVDPRAHHARTGSVTYAAPRQVSGPPPPPSQPYEQAYQVEQRPMDGYPQTYSIPLAYQGTSHVPRDQGFQFQPHEARSEHATGSIGIGLGAGGNAGNRVSILDKSYLQSVEEIPETPEPKPRKTRRVVRRVPKATAATVSRDVHDEE